MRFLASVGQFGWFALLIAQVVLAVVLGARALKMNPATARVLFYVYAATMGFTLSTIFFIYDIGSIGIAFGLTAAFFLCLTMIGLTTKANMLKAGPILMVGLVVLIVSQLVLMLFQVSGATMIVSAISLILFAGLTIYDAQSTRALYQQLGTSDVMVRRISILAALNLYLDFINMFMSLLQLFGSRN
jgi:FtsH-binding integral membrane protein